MWRGRGEKTSWDLQKDVWLVELSWAGRKEEAIMTRQVSIFWTGLDWTGLDWGNGDFLDCWSARKKKKKKKKKEEEEEL